MKKKNLKKDFLGIFNLSDKNWKIVKINGKGGFFVGMVREIPEITDFDKYEVELENGRFSEDEAEEKLDFWQKKTGLPIFGVNNKYWGEQ
jgi:hypothetical protein